MVERYCLLRQSKPDQIHTRECAEVFSRRFVQYYQEKYNADILAHKKRKSTALSSAQSMLSIFKKRLSKLGAPQDTFLKHLHISLAESKQLVRTRNAAVHAGAIHLHNVKADAVIRDCRQFLDHENPYLVTIGLACLTGRRMAEILYSIKFDAPREVHRTNDKYWTSASGFVKQRNGTDLRREIPLLETRIKVNAAIERVRIALPALSPAEVNFKYAKPIARLMKKFCPVIGKLHQFRKFYALACFHYFNDSNCSLARLASDYLGHKNMSSTVLTYMNFRLVDLGSLIF